jgi:integrase
MPRRKKDPSYRFHKQSGQAIVTLPDGLGGRRDVLLGDHGSDQSWDEYNRVLTEWKASGKRLPPPAEARADLTINELILRYWQFVGTYYLKDGEPTSEQDTIRQALRFVRQLYGHSVAERFGPLALKAIRQAMIDHPMMRRIRTRNAQTGEVQTEQRVLHRGLARRFINKQIARIKRMFAWAVEEELLPVTVHQALLCVKGLKKGKSQAREKAPIRPVPDPFVEAVQPYLPPTIWTMIQVQRLSGGRPQDIVQMRAIDIDTTSPIWEYRPARYKTQHHHDDIEFDRQRIVFLGPRAQALLKPYFTLNVTDYLFSPIRSEQARNDNRRQHRRSPMTPSHSKRKARGRKRAPLRAHYDVASYRRAIRRACIKAGIPIWSPLQLRHSRGTEIRKCYGLEASQAVLGHSELGVTQIYAEVDHDTARRVMAEIG